MHYYTYAYLREDKTPYYIGKGIGNRIYYTNRKGLKPPKDKSKISQIHKKSGLLPPSHKGTRWWNNGQINKRSIECLGKEWILGKVIKCQLT